jgi:hypothetical protein
MTNAFRFHWLPVLLGSALASACIGSGNSVNAYAGTRSIDSSDFNGIDDPTVYGLDAVLKLNIPWLAVEAGWFHSYQDESSASGLTDPELTLDEYFVGLRVVPWDFLVEPYGSIGVSYLDGELDATSGGNDVGDSGQRHRLLRAPGRRGAPRHLPLRPRRPLRDHRRPRPERDRVEPRQRAADGVHRRGILRRYG